MIITYPLELTVEQYAVLGKKNEFPVIECCPLCGGVVRLIRHGFYFRNAIDGKDEYRIPICRMKCPSCAKTASLLPDFLLPYFQHVLGQVLAELKQVLTGTLKGCRQRAQFYRERFLEQLTRVEMFLRAEGYRQRLPQGKEKAIKLLEMLLAFGEAPFVRRWTGHFTSNFMAR